MTVNLKLMISRPPPLSELGQKIRACIDSSGEDTDTEDDFELVGGVSDSLSTSKPKNSWREVKA